MNAEIRRADPSREFLTQENCFILELANDSNDPDVSITRARVLPGVTTEWHSVRDVDERYIIVSGKGKVEVGDLPPTVVSEGDVVRIPATRRSASPTSATSISCSFAGAVQGLCRVRT